MIAGTGGAVVISGDRHMTERVAAARYARGAAVVRPAETFAEPLAAVIEVVPPPQPTFSRGRQSAAFAAQALDSAAMDDASAGESPAERVAGHYRAALARVTPQPESDWRVSVVA